MLSELEGPLWSIHWECHFADNLNLMCIFNHERRARVQAALGRQLALSLQMERREKEVITSILMTTAPLCRCKLCRCKLRPHLSPEQVDEEKGNCN